MPGPPPTLADAVAALKKFEGAILDTRHAHSTQWWYVGVAAPPELIAHFRANPRLLPKDLVDLYELMNGCGLSWGFFTEPMPPEGASEAEWERWEAEVEYGPTVGQFYLEPLSYASGMTTDHENQYTFFGPGAVSTLVDQLQPEYGTWLVADSPGHSKKPAFYHPSTNHDPAADEAARATADVAHARLVFLYSKDDEQPIPVGLAEYIMQGLAHGFVGQWPLAVWDSHTYLGQTAAEESAAVMERLRTGVG